MTVYELIKRVVESMQTAESPYFYAGTRLQVQGELLGKDRGTTWKNRKYPAVVLQMPASEQSAGQYGTDKRASITVYAVQRSQRTTKMDERYDGTMSEAVALADRFVSALKSHPDTIGVNVTNRIERPHMTEQPTADTWDAVELDVDVVFYESGCAAPVARPTCYPATWTLVNSLDDEQGSGSIASGGSEVIEAPDAQYVVEDLGGTELASGSIPSGDNETIVISPSCPDGSVSVDNTEGTEVASGNVPSGGSLDLTAPDGTTDVQNTLGNTVATGTPPSGGTDTVTAPDASYTVEDQDGTELATGSIPSGDSETVTVTVPRDLFLIVNVSSDDDTAVLSIGAEQAGDIDTLAAGGLTSVTYDLNGSPATLPFTLADGDTLTVSFDAAGSDTSFTLSGTY